ncbi:hypothetical protein FOA52_014630 [Chlamydomonas sp. UWO 241]|nr:hypothetical protein FOA52_014630 [Chlamydomonas sp. UWO 241]
MLFTGAHSRQVAFSKQARLHRVAGKLGRAPRRPGSSMAAHANADADAPGASALVSPQWVTGRLGDPSVKVLDASWFMPVHKRDAVGEFKTDRIPGSLFYDTDGIADPSTGLPHMVPSESAFAAAMDALGVASDSHVVLYDRLGLFSAPRAWWTFLVFGHSKVSVMEGGMPAWRALDLPLDASPVSDDDVAGPARAARGAPPPPAKYPAKLDASKVRSRDAVLSNVISHAERVVDARSAGRFVGAEPEPRPGLKGGHIPGARNVPFPSVVAPGGSLKPADELRAVFSAAGVDLDDRTPLVASCGSGLTACVLALAVFKATGKLIPVYDGSWMEWGDPARCDTNPVATALED